MLTLDTKKEHTPEAGVKKTLEGYLFAAKQFIGNSTKAIAASRAQDYVEGADLSSFTNNPEATEKAIAAKEKELKAEAKKYGLQEKMNYAFDTRAVEADKIEAVAQPMFTAIATGLAVSTMAVAGSAEGAVAMGAMGMAIGVALSTGRFLSRAENKDEAKKIEEYAEIKHAMLALKKLKKQVTPTVSVNYVPKNEKTGANWVPSAREMLAGGLGNPGGIITNVALNKKRER